MSDPAPDPPPERDLLPAYGLITGSAIAVLVAVLADWDLGWMLIIGAGLGLVAGTALWALRNRR